MQPGVTAERTRKTRFHPAGIRDRAFDYFPRLQRCRRYVELHYAEPLTLDTVAAVAGLERTYFSAYFHARIGVRYRDWLCWMRVNEALKLIADSDARLTDICYAVGFQDLRTFERSFERCTGESPQRARRNAAGPRRSACDPNS